MNLKQKLYQMFILGCEGDGYKDALKNGLGGIIFFTKDIQSTEQFCTLINDIKSQSLIPPFLSIDQEGGRVERTENIHGRKKYLSAKFAYSKGVLKEQTFEIAQELKSYGINLNFAPCIDVNTNPDNPIIGERAFSDNAEEVIKCEKIVSQIYRENGIIPCVKHFPGHGDANADSHLTLPKIDLSLEEMQEHIAPFRACAKTIEMVMVAHLHCTCFEKEVIPTSLSKNAISYLRGLGFDGVAISDDMVMKGATHVALPNNIGQDIHTVDGGVTHVALPNNIGQDLHTVDDGVTHVVLPNNIGQDLHTVDNGAVARGVAACECGIRAGLNMFIYRNSAPETIEIIENIYQKALTDKELQENIEKSYEKIMKLKRANIM